MPNPENSNTSKRIEFVRETTTGVTPSDPNWLLFSDTVEEVSGTIDVQSEARRGVSSADPDAHHAGPESVSISVNYFLQRWLTDSTADASDDFVSRNADGQLPNTHSVMIREERTTGSLGAAGGGIRTYTVGKGGYADVTIEFDPSTGLPIMVTLDYTFEKVRSYQIDQPSSGTTIDLSSDDASDTQDVTIEDEGSSTSETITLSGTSTVTTTASFSDIDAVELSAESSGDITLSDGTNDLMVLRGTNSLPDGYEGDLGVPALGSGSHESALGSTFEIFLGDSIERPSGTAIAANIASGELSIDNGIETSAKAGNQRMNIREGNRTAQLSATVHGETESHDQIDKHILHSVENIIWTATGGSIQLDNAVLKDAIERSYSEGDAKMEIDVMYEGDGVTIT